MEVPLFDIKSQLEQAGVKLTPNRVLVLNALEAAECPKSLIELETELETLDRSSILRVLNLLVEHDVIHTMEDGRGISKYEMCYSSQHCSINDMHAHFYCIKCERTFCFEQNKIPKLDIPCDFEIRSANLMFKGVCPNCKNH